MTDATGAGEGPAAPRRGGARGGAAAGRPLGGEARKQPAAGQAAAGLSGAGGASVRRAERATHQVGGRRRARRARWWFAWEARNDTVTLGGVPACACLAAQAAAGAAGSSGAKAQQTGAHLQAQQQQRLPVRGSRVEAQVRDRVDQARHACELSTRAAVVVVHGSASASSSSTGSCSSSSWRRTGAARRAAG